MAIDQGPLSGSRSLKSSPRSYGHSGNGKRGMGLQRLISLGAVCLELSLGSRSGDREIHPYVFFEDERCRGHGICG